MKTVHRIQNSPTSRLLGPGRGVVNHPSGGSERAVFNGLFVMPRKAAP